MFTDRVTFKLMAGKGGNGAVSWRREKYIPKGGPTGGNGGKGGSVILRSDQNTYSLEAYRNRRLLRAEDAKAGGPNRKTGRGGKDLILKIPVGTLVKDINDGSVLFDFSEPGQEWRICEGGKGGRGNESFKTPTNRAPNQSTPGRPGEEKEVELELKLIADVGLVGFPNAGKSTLISTVAQVEVAIAPYPFTTLKPNLGYIQFDDYSRVLIADIPGIIEGAHENKGLGFEFLRHVERTEALVYVLDASCIDGRHPLDDFSVLRKELEQYEKGLMEKPWIVVLNKMDVEDAEEVARDFREESGIPSEKIFEISALNREGIGAVVSAMRELAQRNGKRFY